jgi:hypothetical protein
MPDFDAIATALAARFISPALAAPPAGGYDTVRVSTADLPGQMTPLPTVLVFLDDGTFNHSAGKRDSVHSFLVRFYYNQVGDLERDMVALRKWLTILVDQLRLASQLGGLVTQAKVMTWKVAIIRYADVEYSGIELGVSINVNEPWSPVS